MFEQLYLYFLNLFSWNSGELDYLDNIHFDIGGEEIYFTDYLTTTFTLISFTIILVICGLFIKKLVSTVAHLLGN